LSSFEFDDNKANDRLDSGSTIARDDEISFDLSDFDENFDVSTANNTTQKSNDILNAKPDQDITFDLSEFDADEDILGIDSHGSEDAFGLDANVSTPNLNDDVPDLDNQNVLETKIDLARAYIDMGDVDAAKNIIEKILKEGNQEQKNIAQELMDSLS
jgi:pilus assembly protein FimV